MAEDSLEYLLGKSQCTRPLRFFPKADGESRSWLWYGRPCSPRGRAPLPQVAHAR